jgi:hypothetical protein
MQPKIHSCCTYCAGRSRRSCCRPGGPGVLVEPVEVAGNGIAIECGYA